MEIWKSIPGYEGYYSVSNIGRVRRDKAYRATYAGRILKGGKHTKGYVGIALSKDNNSTHFPIHKLVCAAFIGKRPKDFDINHKNGIKDDNRLENLEYCTKSANAFHAHKMGNSYWHRKAMREGKRSSHPQRTNKPCVWYYEERGRIRICIEPTAKFLEVTIKACDLKRSLSRILFNPKTVQSP